VHNAGAGGQISIEEYHQLVMVRGYRWDAAIEGGFVPVFRDTVLTHVSRDTLMNVTVPSIDRNEWKTLHFYPWLPDVPTGDVFTDAAFGTDGQMSLESPFLPYTDNNTSGYLGYMTGAQWAIQLQITTLGLDARFSNARLVYLGD